MFAATLAVFARHESPRTMTLASLTVYGDDLTLESIREALPSEPLRDWRKGDARGEGRVYLDSGFEVIIAERGDPLLLPQKIRVYLSECRSRGITFAVPRIVAELKIALDLGDVKKAQAGIDFSLTELETLVNMGVALNFAARPADA